MFIYKITEVAAHGTEFDETVHIRLDTALNQDQLNKLKSEVQSARNLNKKAPTETIVRQALDNAGFSGGEIIPSPIKDEIVF